MTNSHISNLQQAITKIKDAAKRANSLKRISILNQSVQSIIAGTAQKGKEKRIIDALSKCAEAQKKLESELARSELELNRALSAEIDAEAQRNRSQNQGR